ncbi:DUF58 domain-containing protein [Natronorubrum halophilum]|uniref:DUF58 domain-containing protein n=1 Tax=Natronorubrum halophilum TaxID=1702106 RepID=UPI0010C20AD6|nr:DUF58 domain-containing protein [Natronorubrum halophilum]
MNARRVAVSLGIAVLLCALAISAGALEFSMARGTIVLVGLLAIGIGLSALTRGYNTRSRTDTPDPERRSGVPAPGRSLSAAADEFREPMTDYVANGRRLTIALKSAAVAVLTRFEGDSTDQASRRLEDGTWTDDPIAAAFLSDSLETPTRSLRTRLASVVSGDGETAFQSNVRHTVRAITAIRDDRSAADGDRPLPEYEYDPDVRGDPYDRTRAGGSGSNPQLRTRTTTDSVDGVEPRRRRSTDHWTGIGAVALFAVGVGAVAESPAVVLAGVVGVGYAGFARALEPPELDLSLERSVSDDDPEPGDELEVVLTIANESDAFVPDLRIVDGVPASLAVTDGSSRLGTALRPGEAVTLEYTVTARRGSHEFDPALVLARDLSRSTEREFLIDAETTVVCEPSMRPLATAVPLRAATTSFAGRVRTADGGSGTTIHSVREYRRSDPLNRVDWNRHAKTGELATLEFHEERAARVVVLVDARLAAYRAPTPDAAHAVDRSVDAAGRIGASLFAAGETVGLAAIGPLVWDETDPSGTDPCWLPPASGRHHEVRFQEALATHPQFATLPPDHECRWRRQLRRIRRRLPSDTQIIFLTTLCDDGSVGIARQLEAHGHPVTVVSPDPTADRTVGHQLARVARHLRRVDLERARTPVIDWPDDDTLDTAIARHAGGRR